MGTDKSKLGDRMKELEGAEGGRRFMPLIPIVARIDGRAFHTFTKGMKCPYDEKMSNAMIQTTKALVKETNANMGYTQSDEISLVWHSTDIRSQIWFDGRIQKMTSQLAALATLHFYREVLLTMPEYADKMPTFDARVWQVPNRTEATNVFVWREWDATKNSISMAAHSVYSDKDLHKKNGNEKQEMLFQIGINWNDYPTVFKRGAYIQRKSVLRPFTTEELAKLPAKHNAWSNPELKIERKDFFQIELPPIASIENREDVIFEGAEPKIYKK